MWLFVCLAALRITFSLALGGAALLPLPLFAGGLVLVVGGAEAEEILHFALEKVTNILFEN